MRGALVNPVWIEQLTMMGYVVLAMGLSAVIGWEREQLDRPAGFRTHMLVGGAAALIVVLSDIITERVGLHPTMVRSDPLRLIEAVVAGVSFLGAGTIFRSSNRDTVEGLTTAASLLFVAVIGICVAVDQIITAIGMTALAFVILQSGHLFGRPSNKTKPTTNSSAE